MRTVPVYIYGNNNGAVKINSSNEVVLSADSQGAAAFQMVECLASSNVSATQRPACFSFMDATRPGWYVRHSNYFLQVDPINRTKNLTLFNSDSSFIVYPSIHKPGSYVLQSVNYHQHVISAQADGRLKIVPHQIADFQRASFTFFAFNASSTYPQSVCLMALYKFV